MRNFFDTGLMFEKENVLAFLVQELCHESDPMLSDAILNYIGIIAKHGVTIKDLADIEKLITENVLPSKRSEYNLIVVRSLLS